MVASLALSGMAPCSRPDGVGAEDLREMRVPLLGGGQLGLLRALDQRAHPVDLRALGQLHAQALDQPLDGVDGMDLVTIGLRPAGFSVSRDTSRSP